jgi:hypothetical protein
MSLKNKVVVKTIMKVEKPFMVIGKKPEKEHKKFGFKYSKKYKFLRKRTKRFDLGVWFHTPRLAAAQITQRLQKLILNQRTRSRGEGIINFLSNEPPFKQR